MPISVKNIPAADMIPFPKDLTPILIATVYGSDNTTNNNDAGNILNANDEDTKWTSKGKGEYVFAELSGLYNVRRLDIEWDPELPRTGSFEVDFIADVATTENPNPTVQVVTGQQDTSMFTIIESQTNIPCRYIKIVCNGNADDDNDLNGITGIKLWGSES